MRIPRFSLLTISLLTLMMASLMGIFSQWIPWTPWSEETTLIGHRERVRHVEFSNNGKLVVSASNDNSARLWQAESGECLQILEGHIGPVISSKFSHDGKYIVTASKDCTVRVWETDTGKCLSVLKGHKRSLLGAVFCSVGKAPNVEASCRDGIVIKWDALSGKVLSTQKAPLRHFGKTRPLFPALWKSRYRKERVISPNRKLQLRAEKDGRVCILKHQNRVDWERSVARLPSVWAALLIGFLLICSLCFDSTRFGRFKAK